VATFLASTSVYSDLSKQADDIVERIIADNAAGIQPPKKKATIVVPHT